MFWLLGSLGALKSVQVARIAVCVNRALWAQLSQVYTTFLDLEDCVDVVPLTLGRV